MNEFDCELSPEIIGKRLMAVRRSRKLTQSYVANALGVSQSAVSALEKEGKCQRTTFIVKLIQFYGVPYETIFGRVDTGSSKAFGGKEITAFELLKELLYSETQKYELLDIAADSSIKLYVYIILRSLYVKNPHSTESVFKIPFDTALNRAMNILRETPKRLDEIIEHHHINCSELEVPVESSEILRSFIAECESLIGTDTGFEI